MHSPEPRALAREALIDLAERAHSGLPIHLPLWVLVGGLNGVYTSLPAVFWGQAALFAGLLFLRWTFERPLARKSFDHPAAAVGVRMLLLSNPLVWGALGLCSMVWPPMQALQTPLIFILIGLAAAGGMAFGFDAIVRIGYPLLALAPGVVSLVLLPSQSSLYLACLAVVFAVYIIRASHSVHVDYWSAVHARVELERRALQLERLSVIDALTQVHNRQFLDRQLAVEWARAGRDARALSILMIDLDHFKQINDRHGHPFGDRCLQAVAQALRDTLKRPGDLVARYGGEEFVVLLPGLTSERAAQVADRLHRVVAAITLDADVDGPPVRISCSIGVHTVANIGEGSAADALSIADQALYAAKRQGRDRVVVTEAA